MVLATSKMAHLFIAAPLINLPYLVVLSLINQEGRASRKLPIRVELLMPMDMKHTVNTRSSSGYTLIEVVMALLLIAILAAIAIPNYRGAMQTMRASELSNDFITALSFTRAEAIKRNTPVTICAAADSSFSSCGANTGWANGWIIFVDPNADGVIGSTGTILKTHDPLLTGSTIVTTMGFIVYNRSGFLGSSAGTLTLTVPGCTGNSAVLITLSLTGWASVTSTACTMA